MLPTRLFRNLGIPPPLRSLIKIHPSLSPSVAVQLRFRLQLAPRTLITSTRVPASRRLHTSAPWGSQAPVASPPPDDASTAPQEPPEPRLQLTFTCTVTDCAERSSHEFTRRAYERGIVIVTCPKCTNKHLIADHLGWFNTTDGTDGGQLRTIEDIMRAKGEKVSRGRLDAGGVVEYLE
ncbi:DNL zinc finger-domain-containing protein [Phellopilus nigrolimitatus]|nr:DNL zinc finger-domain-containing protein [Phellopilus nigrolimitatus]